MECASSTSSSDWEEENIESVATPSYPWVHKVLTKSRKIWVNGDHGTSVYRTPCVIALFRSVVLPFRKKKNS